MAEAQYRTKQGDMWDQIAYDTYGDETAMAPLLAANPDHVATLVFEAGAELTLPPDDEIALRPEVRPRWQR